MLQEIRHPQGLHAAIQAVSAHCQRVLERKDGSLDAIRALLRVRDEQYIKLLQAQGQETDSLIATMHAQHGRLRGVQERELEAVEGAYMQVHGWRCKIHGAALYAMRCGPIPTCPPGSSAMLNSNGLPAQVFSNAQQ